jgi:hypothetical protein
MKKIYVILNDEDSPCAVCSSLENVEHFKKSNPECWYRALVFELDNFEPQNLREG